MHCVPPTITDWTQLVRVLFVEMFELHRTSHIQFNILNARIIMEMDTLQQGKASVGIEIPCIWVCSCIQQQLYKLQVVIRAGIMKRCPTFEVRDIDERYLPTIVYKEK